MVGPQSSYYTWSWAAIVLVWTLAAFGLASAVWALFADRSRGRRRCAKCWYDMGGVPGLVCPECGKVAKTEKGLHRTKRRYGLALLALIVSMAPASVPTWRFFRAEEYWAWTPRRLLIWSLPWGSSSWKYMQEFRKRVVAESYDYDGWRSRVSYSASGLSPAETGLLEGRIIDALESATPGVPREDLLEMASQLGFRSKRLRPIVIAGLSEPNWQIRRVAMTIARQQRYSPEESMRHILAMVAEVASDSALAVSEDECLAEAAGYLSELGATDPRVVPALVSLLKALQTENRQHGFGRDGYALRNATLRAFAAIGPAAAEALDLLKVSEVDEIWGGDGLSLFAYWVVDGQFGGRCPTLVHMAGLRSWDYRDFAVEELGRGEPCPEAIAVLERSMGDEMHWVRIDAAMSLIRLGRPSEAGYAVLKEDAADNFDAFWRITRFAIERGLDPAPLEAMIPAYRQPSSRVPDVNVDNVERELREYREHRPASEPFEPW